MTKPIFDPKKLVIRNLRSEDQNALVRIDSHTVGYPRNRYFDRKFTRFFGDDAPILLSLIAEYEGKIVGYIMGEVNTGEYGIPEPVASIDTLGVEPEFKRMGIGKILLEDYCSLAEKAGIELMTTLISQDYPDIIEFFKMNNFTPARMVALDRKLSPSSVFEK